MANSISLCEDAVNDSGLLIIPPLSKHTHTAIILHGLGSNGTKFGSELIQTAITSTNTSLPKAFPGMKFIFPTAKRSRSAAFKRTMIRQWFNKASVSDPSKRRDLQIDGLTDSTREILSLVYKETEYIPSENIVLGGLSQGCAMALFVLLSSEYTFGAFFGMSGYLPFYSDLQEAIDDSQQLANDDFISFGNGEITNETPLDRTTGLVRDLVSMTAPQNASKSIQDVPMFLGHGENDEKIDLSLGKQAAHLLGSLGLPVTWKSYPNLGHWYKIPDEIDDLVRFLQEALQV